MNRPHKTYTNEWLAQEFEMLELIGHFEQSKERKVHSFPLRAFSPRKDTEPQNLKSYCALIVQSENLKLLQSLLYIKDNHLI